MAKQAALNYIRNSLILSSHIRSQALFAETLFDNMKMSTRLNYDISFRHILCVAECERKANNETHD